MDVMIEDTIFRVIKSPWPMQFATAMPVRWVFIFEDEEDYLIELQDNGGGFETLTYGYGLKQMMERISILGGTDSIWKPRWIFHARQFTEI